MREATGDGRFRVRSLAWVKWTILTLGGILLGAAIVTVDTRRLEEDHLRLPLAHNLLVEPLDTALGASLLVFALPYRVLRDSLVGACADYRRDSAALARARLPRDVGQVWRDRWRDMIGRLAQRLDDLRPLLATESVAVSAGGQATFRPAPGSSLVLVSRSTAVAVVLRSRALGDQLAPLSVLCRP